MPFRQIHRLTSAKLMSDTQAHFCKVNDFYWISNNYPSFFLFLPPKTPKIASSLPPALPGSSLPPFPEVFFRAPAEGSLPRPPSLRFITRSPLFAYTFLVYTSAFPFVLFGSPISILLRPHPYCLVLPFSMLTVVFYSFPPSFSLLFPFVPLFLFTPITLQVHKIPLFSPCEIQKYPNFVTYHHFFHENLLAFQNLGIYFAPRNNEILSLLVSPVLSFLPFPSPPAVLPRGERGGISVSPLS